MGHRVSIRIQLAALLVGAGLSLVPTSARADTYYISVSGLAGEPDYQQRFTATAQELEKALKASGPAVHVHTLTGDDATRRRLEEVFAQVAKAARPEDDFVLILVGHGSYDGVEYKYNLVGPDISAVDLSRLCNGVASKRQLIVNTTSSSGGSMGALQRKGRAVIAATKSGTEKNATVFGRFFAEAFQDPAADVDKNDAVSALEAFQYADRKTADFYTSQKRLATEHPTFEDTGTGEPVRQAENGEGRLLASMALIRLGTAGSAALDPAKRDLLAMKEKTESEIDILKYQKAAMSPRDYEQQLKALLLELARVQAALDQ
jgi:hypothetical protein